MPAERFAAGLLKTVGGVASAGCVARRLDTGLLKSNRRRFTGGAAGSAAAMVCTFCPPFALEGIASARSFGSNSSAVSVSTCTMRRHSGHLHCTDLMTHSCCSLSTSELLAQTEGSVSSSPAALSPGNWMSCFRRATDGSTTGMSSALSFVYVFVFVFVLLFVFLFLF